MRIARIHVLSGLIAAGLLGVAVIASGGGSASIARSTVEGCGVSNELPAWSPDGTEIAFVSDRDGGNAGWRAIWVMSADGSGARKLVSYIDEDLYPAWSPDGSKIAFARFVPDRGVHWIHVVNSDGTGVRELARGTAPAWSPRGDKIAFSTGRDGNAEIYVMNADGTDQRNLTQDSGQDTSPAWSPDGRKIAFVRYADNGTFDIYSMSGDGSGVSRLTNTRSREDRPTWSPDGSRIAFWDEQDGLSIMNADGSDVRRVPLPRILSSYEPDWSRSGRIAFSGGLCLARDIYAVEPDGSQLRNLTQMHRRVLSRSFRTVPGTARAGRNLTAILTVTDEVKAPIEDGTSTCRAAAGRRPLRLVSQAFAESQARCTWFVPRRAKGKRLSGSIAVLFGNQSAGWTFRRRVR